MTAKRIILVVGHQKSATGAFNKETGTTEFDFNSRLVPMIAEKLGPAISAFCLIVDVPHWKKAPIINEMATKMPCAAVIEFHLNSSDCSPRTNYCLAKYAKGSGKGKLLSEKIIEALTIIGINAANWQETNPKGVYATEPTPPKDQQYGEWWDKNGWKYRGASFLHKTKPPAVLLETFFISCTEFLRMYDNPHGVDLLATAISGGIEKFFSEEESQGGT